MRFSPSRRILYRAEAPLFRCGGEGSFCFIRRIFLHLQPQNKPAGRRIPPHPPRNLPGVSPSAPPLPRVCFSSPLTPGRLPPLGSGAPFRFCRAHSLRPAKPRNSPPDGESFPARPVSSFFTPFLQDSSPICQILRPFSFLSGHGSSSALAPRQFPFSVIFRKYFSINI